MRLLQPARQLCGGAAIDKDTQPPDGGSATADRQWMRPQVVPHAALSHQTFTSTSRGWTNFWTGPDHIYIWRPRHCRHPYMHSRQIWAQRRLISENCLFLCLWPRTALCAAHTSTLTLSLERPTGLNEGDGTLQEHLIEVSGVLAQNLGHTDSVTFAALPRQRGA